jgi:hypothetical protein
MKTQWDPWDDAGELAQKLAEAGTLLYIVIGAEQWCSKCRDLRPQFDSLADQATPNEVWLWLDLEDHSEFVGDYSPPGLPILLAYRGAELHSCQLIENTPDFLAQAIDQIREFRHAGRYLDAALSDPGIRARLLMEDWAT